jgi:diacylglycerol kinase (ATP)
MRILAAGGDGTVAWILKTIRELDMHPEPNVAVMPLGTGNDLSLSFGWGNTFLQSWINVTSMSRASPPHMRVITTLLTVVLAFGLGGDISLREEVLFVTCRGTSRSMRRSNG